MKKITLMITVTVLMLATGSALAQMGGGMGPGMMPGPMPGPGPGPNPGPNPGPGPASGWGCGKGYGTHGIGGMGSMMFGNTLLYGYLGILNPIGDATEARAAFQAFINAANSSLQISELWEYGTVYKAELSDTNGAKAFDLIADKFTGVVFPEMGMSMMLNASYGNSIYKKTTFAKNLTLTPLQATQNAQNFLDKNPDALPYTLDAPEIYPGYYKFHTIDKNGKPGFDIMVNGYNGGIWMDTFLGLPVKEW